MAGRIWPSNLKYLAANHSKHLATLVKKFELSINMPDKRSGSLKSTDLLIYHRFNVDAQKTVQKCIGRHTKTSEDRLAQACKYDIITYKKITLVKEHRVLAYANYIFPENIL